MSITHITTCLLCSKERPSTIKADPLPQVSNVEELALSEVSARLVKAVLLLMMVLSASKLASTDPAFPHNLEIIRAYIHRITRKNDVTERDLQIRWENLYGCEDEQETMAGLKDLRDYLLEEGDYAPQRLAPEMTRSGEPLVKA